MVTPDINKNYTPEEYFLFDEKAELKHEFHHGKLFEIPNATKQHNRLVKKIVRILEDKSNKDFEVFCLQVKVETLKNTIFLYPDIVVANAAEQNLSAYVVANPILIIEVLSDLSRKYDSTDKFIQYSKIESLKYYLLIEPEKHIVIAYEKLNGEWFSKPFTELTEEVKLPLLEA